MDRKLDNNYKKLLKILFKMLLKVLLEIEDLHIKVKLRLGFWIVCLLKTKKKRKLMLLLRIFHQQYLWCMKTMWKEIKSIVFIRKVRKIVNKAFWIRVCNILFNLLTRIVKYRTFYLHNQWIYKNKYSSHIYQYVV